MPYRGRPHGPLAVAAPPSLVVARNTDSQHGDLAPNTADATATINDDGLVSVQLLNTTKETIAYKLQIADRYADVTIPANSVQTVRVQR